MKTYYLAHPFDSRNEIRKWQTKLEKRFKNKIKIINPFFPMRKYEIFKESDISSNDYYNKLDFVNIVKDDIKLIKECDCIIIIINGKLSYGTIQEMIYGYLLGKEVILICTNKHDKHPWLQFHSYFTFTKFEEFEEWLNKNL